MQRKGLIAAGFVSHMLARSGNVGWERQRLGGAKSVVALRCVALVGCGRQLGVGLPLNE